MAASIIESAFKVLSRQHRYGHIVQLTAKCVGVPEENLYSRPVDFEKDQFKLAKITDTIHFAQLAHRGVVTFVNGQNANAKDLNSCNKMSTLIGDYFLAIASHKMAELKNCSIVSLMSRAIGDHVEGEFLKFEVEKRALAEHQNDEILMDAITHRSYLSGGSLLAHGCKAVSLIAGHSSAHSVTSDGQSSFDVVSISRGNDSFSKLATADKAFFIGSCLGSAIQVQDAINEYSSCNGTACEERIKNLMKQSLETHLGRVAHLINTLRESDSTQALRTLALSIANNNTKNDSFAINDGDKGSTSRFY